MSFTLLFSKYSQKFRSFFIGDTRSVQLKKQILYSYFLRGINIVVSFILVPLALSFVTKIEYGIWLTISQILNWMSFFKMGLGQGMGNKLAEALALDDLEKAKKLVSTAYISISSIMVTVFLIFLLIQNFLNYQDIFNTKTLSNSDLGLTFLFVMIFFVLKFVLQNLNSMLLSLQQSSVTALIDAVTSVVTLIVIFLLTKIAFGSLFLLAVVYSGIPTIILAGFTIRFFRKYPFLKPSFGCFEFVMLKDLGGLGFLFLINQLNQLVLFMSSSILITQFFGPDEVVPYNLVYRYFGLIPMLFDIFTLPMWGAFAEAFTKNDLSWIKRVVDKTQRIWLVSNLILMFMICAAPLFFRFWVGNSVEVPLSLSILMAVQVSLFCYVNVYSRFLNGVSKIKLASFYSVFQACINIPLAILFVKILGLGLDGIILGTIICLLPAIISHPIQYNRIMKGVAIGVWNK